MRQAMLTGLHKWDIGDLDENGYGESYELGWESYHWKTSYRSLLK